MSIRYSVKSCFVMVAVSPAINSDGMDVPSPAACTAIRPQRGEDIPKLALSTWQSGVSRFTVPDGPVAFRWSLNRSKALHGCSSEIAKPENMQAFQ